MLLENRVNKERPSMIIQIIKGLFCEIDTHLIYHNLYPIEEKFRERLFLLQHFRKKPCHAQQTRGWV